MNLSPHWVPVLEASGWKTVHWPLIGQPSAPDQEIFEYAKSHGYVIFTHDLDFGAILAATNAENPSRTLGDIRADNTLTRVEAFLDKVHGITIN